MLFTDLNINSSLFKALEEMNITTPTTIQEKTFPVVMSGADMIGIAQTGTGKTLAYLLPSLRQWKYSRERHPSMLIVVPTRELVMQVCETLEQLSKYMNVRFTGVFGGVNMVQQTPLLLEGVDVLVGTPGRLLDFLLNGTLSFKLIKKFVIDEVDEMLNLGFRPQLVRLMDFLPTKRQNLMFSATLAPEVNTFIEDYFIDPVYVEAARSGTPLVNIKQAGIVVPNYYTKVNLLKYFLKNNSELSKVILFVSTKALADQLYDSIQDEYDEQIGVMHANKSQNYRFENLRKFNNGEVRMLIATDLIARGLDFDDVTHVINFDMPEDAENYMHRIGRTGRVDKKGVAISFISPQDKAFKLEIEQLMGIQIPLMGMPDEVVVSNEIAEFEKPQVKMKNVLVKPTVLVSGGGAFHEKLDKNKKVNQKIRRVEAMKIKYGKPKTRGQKKK